VFGVLTLQNHEAVLTLKFIKWTLSGNLVVVLAVSFCVGILLSTFLFIPTWWKKTKQVRANKKRINELESRLFKTVEHAETEKTENELEDLKNQ
jgi:uncharacterized integral membrane protein